MEKVKDILVYFDGEEIKPTLRAVFYRLVAINALPNTESMYQSLSQHFVKARKAGEIPFDALIDNARRSIENFGDTHLKNKDVESADAGYTQRIQKLTLDSVIEDYFNYENLVLTLPEDGYWAKQPIIPEVWIEKDAIGGIIERWTSKLHTSIRINRGYPSWSFLYTSIQSLKKVLESHDKVSVLYIGDLDPSGLDMDRFLKETIEYFGMDKRIQFKRLALTEDQVVLHDLPPKPTDTKTLEKLERDPRNKKYDSGYFVEVDAFISLAPKSFKALIQTEIQKYHNSAIAAEVAEQNTKIVDECRAIRAKSIKQAKAVLVKQILGMEK